MASILIHITKPVIPPGSSATIAVSYRLVGITEWTFFGNQTNAPFTLTVPVEGDYEILAEYEDCEPAIYGPIHVLPVCACPIYASSYLVRKSGTTTVIRINFVGTPPAPVCGYIFEYKRGSAPPITISPAVLTNPFEVIVDPGFDYSWTLKINCCAQQINICNTGQLTAASTVDECISGEIKPGTSSPHTPYLSGGKYYFDILFKQSDPATIPVTMVWNQVGASLPGVSKDVGSASVTPIPSGDPAYPWKVTVEVHPNPVYPLGYSVWMNNDICERDVWWY